MNLLYPISLTPLEVKLWDDYCKKNWKYEDIKDHNSHQFKPEGYDSNRYGIAGELVLNKYFGKSVETTLLERPLKHKDKGYDSEIIKYKWDVKLHPSVYDWQMINAQDKCNDGYIIINTKNFIQYYIVGYVLKSKLPEKAEYHKCGEHRGNGFYYKCDTWEIHNDKLNDIKVLKNFVYDYTPDVQFDYKFVVEQKSMFDKLYSFKHNIY